MNSERNDFKPTVKEIIIFGMLGALIFVSKLITEALPNIHLIAVFIVSFSAVYRKKAIYPIMVFVLLTGLFYGFNNWWIPYIYIWLPLWIGVIIVPEKISEKKKYLIYIIICFLHGFLYGTLYAFAQAIMFGLDFKGTIAWIVSGLPFDCIHGVSNLICGLLIPPIVKIMRKVSKTKTTVN